MATPNGALAALRLTVGSILMSPAAQKLDFTLDGFHVTGSGLSYVALALLSQARGQRGVSIVTGGLTALQGATYNMAANTFRFPATNFGQTLFDRMTVVHEAVHALRDSLGPAFSSGGRRVTTRAVADEAAAYVAGGLFFLEDEGPISGSDSTPTWARGKDPYGISFGLALQIRQEQPVGCNVNTFNSIGLQALKDAILADPTYSFLRANPAFRYANNGLLL
jgi:hypothetical protein